MTDFMTVLRARSGVRLTKLWAADGQVLGYEDAKQFDAERTNVANLDELFAVLKGLAPCADRCVIRAGYESLRQADNGAIKSRVLRRVEETYDPPHHWVMLDVDNYTPLADPVDAPAEACAEFVMEMLPPEFHGRPFVWQLSASHGAPGKENLLKAHLWFWLESPADSLALRTWAKNWGQVDAAVFRQVQPLYTAAPLFGEGMADPVAQRLGLHAGEGALATVPLSFLGYISPISASDDLDGSDIDLSSVRESVPGYDLEKVEHDVLSELDPSMDHDTWVQVGMALHHQFNGSDEALELWDTWSSDGASWAEGVCAERWPSFTGDRSAGSVTLRFLLRLVKDAKEREAAILDRRKTAQVVAEKKAERSVVEPLLAHWLARIAGAATPVEIELDIAPGVRALKWADTDRAVLLDSMASRLKALKAPVDKRTVRGWITPVATKAEIGGVAAPWVEDWVWVEGMRKFFNLKTRELLSKDGFNLTCTHLVPLLPGQAAPPAAASYVQQFPRRVAATAVYAPPCEALFDFEGSLLANLHRPGQEPTPEDMPGGDAAELVEAVEAFMALLVPDRRERELLLSWLAHNARRPGVKIGWAPYIHSQVHGTGKTTLAELMSAIMGPGAVQVHKGAALFSRFSGWESECALVMLDEFPDSWARQHGDGVDPYEQLKMVITGTRVSIERKGADVRTAPSFCNVMCVANNLGGIRVAENDRRLFYISSPMTKPQQMANESAGVYGRVYHAIRHGAGVLRAWLLNLPVHPEFRVAGRAPETRARAEAIEQSKSDLQTVIEELLAEGGRGYTRSHASSRHLAAAAMARGGRERYVGNRAVGLLLRAAGFRPISKVKLEGRTENAWTLEPPSANEIDETTLRARVAAELRATLEEAIDAEFEDAQKHSEPDANLAKLLS